ncbi:MAG: hypothetical protein B7Y19_08395 [Sphingobacteriales bacterium 24-40-4]|nr:MAG: hypothetical protein B7Y19_08395 [Sphingobacteriales bacterium 24-40-4]
MKLLIYTIAILLTSSSLWAAEPSVAGGNTGNTFSEVVVILFLIALLFLIVSLVLLKTVKVMANEIKNPALLPVEEPARMMEYSEFKPVHFFCLLNGSIF